MGRSEALWAASAEAALEQGCEVLLSLKRWLQTPEAVTHLSEAGAALHLRDPRGRAARALPRVARRVRPVLQPVIKWRPDVVFVSHGGTYDLTYETDVLRDLKRLEAGGLRRSPSAMQATTLRSQTPVSAMPQCPPSSRSQRSSSLAVATRRRRNGSWPPS